MTAHERRCIASHRQLINPLFSTRNGDGTLRLCYLYKALLGQYEHNANTKSWNSFNSTNNPFRRWSYALPLPKHSLIKPWLFRHGGVNMITILPEMWYVIIYFDKIIVFENYSLRKDTAKWNVQHRTNRARCFYNAINFPQISSQQTPIARPPGWGMCVCCEFQVRFMFCCCDRRSC